MTRTTRTIAAGLVLASLAALADGRVGPAVEMITAAALMSALTAGARP